MIRYVLVALFATLMGSRAFGLDLGFLPGLSIKNLALYAVLLIIAIEMALSQGRQRPVATKVVVPYALLIVYALSTWLVLTVFGILPSYQPMSALVSLKAKLIDQFLVLLVFLYGVTTRENALWVLKGLGWVVVCACLITVIDTFDTPDLGLVTTRPDGRSEGILGSSAEFASMLAFFLPIVIAMSSTTAGWRRLLLGLGVVFVVIAMLLAATRAAVLASILGAIVGALYLRRHISPVMIMRGSVISVVVLVASVVLVMSTTFGSVLQERMATGLQTGNVEQLSSGRSAIWASALQEMLNRPVAFVTGLGWEAYYQTGGHRYATHSVYLDRLYNLGLIGLLLSLSVVLNSIRELRCRIIEISSSSDRLIVGSVFGMTAYAISMMFTDLDMSGIYVWAGMGVALRLAVTSETRHSHEDHFRAALDTREKRYPATRPMSFTPKA